MGLLDLLGRKRARDKPRNSYEGQDFSYLFGRTTSGENVDEFKAMQTTAVYACVRILAEAVASLPIHVYERTETGKEKKVDHSLYFLLHDEPNSEMSSFVFRETLMTHLLIWGNAYVQIIRNRSGQVISLYPLLPDKMSVHRDEIGKLGFDGLIGYSPIALAKNAIGMTLATENYGASFFKNGANPGGVLEHPGILKDPKRVRDSWNAVYNGVTNAHKVAVLEEGMKYTQVGIPPEEAQFLQTRKFQINEIARLYRIPPHMVGDLEKSSFSNIEQQSLEFVKYTLDPWVVRLEQAFKRSLFLPEEKKTYFVKFNVDSLLRGDYQSRMNGYAIGRQNGWLSTNDIRELEDLNLLSDEEGGNLYLINGNMTKLKDAGGFMKQGPVEQEIQSEEGMDA